MLLTVINIVLNEDMIVAVVIAILSNCKLTRAPPHPQILGLERELELIAFALLVLQCSDHLTLRAGQFVELILTHEWSGAMTMM